MSALQTDTEPGLMNLVSGIISDAQDLIKQQLALLRNEVKEDLRKTRDAVLAVAAGLWTIFVGGALLCMMVVYLLQHETGIQLWASFGIVGGLVVLAGGGLLLLAYLKVKSFTDKPSPTTQAMKENVQWITNPPHSTTTPNPR